MSNIFFTGCSKGFGSYIRNKLINQGHKVYGIGVHGPDYELDFNYGSREYHEFRCSDAFNLALEELGSLDVLINNAGMTKIEFMPEHTLEDFDSVLRVNLITPFIFSRLFIKYIKDTWSKESINKSNFARMIHTSSMGTKISLRASPGYCAAKCGLEGLSREFAKELAGRLPISSICVAPGGVDNTEMVDYIITRLQETRGMTKEEAERYNRQSPLGRNATFNEVWKVYDFAVNNSPLYMSGTTLYMDGAFGVA